jgi:hypothetical protein
MSASYSSIMSRSTSSVKMFDAIQTSKSFANSLISSSIEFDVAELFINHSKTLLRSLFTSEIIAHVERNYDEDFNLNKRFFVEESRSISFVSESVANENRRRKKKQRKTSKKVKS